ncbi:MULTISPECIES: hypothetical protein [Enterobacter]|uniref:hypothetical protein n=1 Tax=Enterobacter TaxID=547 RepID=UPI00223544D5|nr:hypothetical protein [Enterobacter mori]MCW4985708.1 hypothetical protein [Enterobacter mori]
MLNLNKSLAFISLFIAPQIFADQNATAMHAQDMAEALQRQADALDDAAWSKRMNDTSGNNMQEVWNAEDAADAAQDAANSAQALADALSE